MYLLQTSCCKISGNAIHLKFRKEIWIGKRDSRPSLVGKRVDWGRATRFDLSAFTRDVWPPLEILNPTTWLFSLLYSMIQWDTRCFASFCASRNATAIPELFDIWLPISVRHPSIRFGIDVVTCACSYSQDEYCLIGLHILSENETVQHAYELMAGTTELYVVP